MNANSLLEAPSFRVGRPGDRDERSITMTEEESLPKKCPDWDIGGSICWYPLTTLKEPCDKLCKEYRCPRGRISHDA
jgi:hypothetical protein